MSELVGGPEPAIKAQQLDKQIRDAYAQAEDCAQRAKIGDLRERSHSLVLGRRWLILARKLEFTQRRDGAGVEAPPAK